VKKILCVEKTPRSRDACDKERLAQFLNQTQQRIKRALKSDFSLEFENDFGYWVVHRLNQGFDGLLTHFPYDSSVLRSLNFEGMDGDKINRAIYANSIKAMQAIRHQLPSIPIVVYSGASTGVTTSPQTLALNKLITEAGANRIVYRHDDLRADAKEIHKHFTELFPQLL